MSTAHVCDYAVPLLGGIKTNIIVQLFMQWYKYTMSVLAVNIE